MTKQEIKQRLYECKNDDEIQKLIQERMEEYTNRDFALVRGENSEIIIIENTK